MYRSSHLSRARNAHIQRWKNSNLLISSSFATLKEIMLNLAAQAAAKKPSRVGASVPPAFNNVAKDIAVPAHPPANVTLLSPSRARDGQIRRRKNSKQLISSSFALKDIVAKLAAEAAAKKPGDVDASVPPPMNPFACRIFTPGWQKRPPAFNNVAMPKNPFASFTPGQQKRPQVGGANLESIWKDKFNKQKPTQKFEVDAPVTTRFESSNPAKAEPYFPVDSSRCDSNLCDRITTLPVQATKLDAVAISSLEVASDSAFSTDLPANVTLLSMQPKKRGRPVKKRDDVITALSPTSSDIAVPIDVSADATTVLVQPKKRGRPAKIRDAIVACSPEVAKDIAVPADPPAIATLLSVPPEKKRGRPAKIRDTDAISSTKGATSEVAAVPKGPPVHTACENSKFAPVTGASNDETTQNPDKHNSIRDFMRTLAQKSEDLNNTNAPSLWQKLGKK